jgi:hypothetical protein
MRCSLDYNIYNDVWQASSYDGNTITSFMVDRSKYHSRRLTERVKKLGTSKISSIEFSLLYFENINNTAYVLDGEPVIL